jgi:DMSO/TMAO reductase YedYZ molybdopterin-dependent catalytic subunit
MNVPPWRAVLTRLPDPGTAAVAVLAGVGGVAGSFAAAGFTPAFVVGPVAGFLSRQLPAAVVTTAILLLGDAGELLNVATAVVLSTLLFAGTALGGLLAGRRVGPRRVGPPLAAVLSALAAYAVTSAAVPSLSAGVAVAAVTGTASFLPVHGDGSVSGERRRLIGVVGTALAVGAGSYVLGSRGGFRPATGGGPLEVDEPVRTEVDSLLAEADEKTFGVDGLEPLVSESFYEVDINATDPTIAADDWTLSVTGAVDEPVTYTYEDVREREPENRFATLRCVGEDLNGRKMDNALWTGVPLADLVEPAGPADECCVMLRAADGYYEEFPLSALEGGFLAYGMNGQTLPRGHGYPARALIPGHWGEINVKWITEVEVLEAEVEGYWEERGWHGTGPVETVAKLHLVDDAPGGRVRVGGHAYAGTRGVETVEVSVDGGETWTEADLSERLPGGDVWRQWLHEYDSPDGEHEVVVRATDGEGAPQPKAETDAFPSGPTGWISRTVDR